MLEELAKAAHVKITVLQGCPLAVEDPKSPAHRPCSEPGGGMMADCMYPSIDGNLDIAQMKLMVNRFLEICCPIIPGKEYMDVANQSEIRMGSDVIVPLGYWGKRHIEIDDDYHHRFDDQTYPHFHLKWHTK
jgi:hypothetical protein